jgi:cytochrome b6-f complex iron-sulfur subunit
MVQGTGDEVNVALGEKNDRGFVMSAKMETPPANEESQTQPSRRSFLNKLWLGLGILATVEVVALVVAFLRPGNNRAKGAGKELIITAGPVDKFPMDSVTGFVRGKFYLARLEDGGFLALSRKCTHLGCTVPWLSKERRFECPCHASEFDIRGEVIRPPAPRALDMYHLFIENNVVKVDTSRLIKRGCFDISQVTYPKT